MNKFIEKLDFYIKSYDVEKELYKRGKKWRKKGFLTKKQFMQICLWKSRRAKKRYDSNDATLVKKITKEAFAESDEKKKIEKLTELKGVRIPVASAILSVTDSDNNYPIIDERCMQALKTLYKIEWKVITSNSWLNYLDFIRKLAREHNKTAREIEKGLFAFNRMELDKDLTNLYS
ncbi:hypothetical protein ACSQ7D_11450 [Capnocytophaga sp. G1920]|jgi:hypothetical protein|uniref:hypothetical protein n=2 Tax=Capnocytophaga TaxID=1016 RepID=UPI00026F2ACD|nr:hypothetical protein [Capnocytophaga sp. oral taxon 335]EJF36110.1 hypothetical protein HMPREF1320_0936 [Capnocytophaga sp. oral taxon 335 str. F0486]